MEPPLRHERTPESGCPFYVLHLRVLKVQLDAREHTMTLVEAALHFSNKRVNFDTKIETFEQ